MKSYPVAARPTYRPPFLGDAGGFESFLSEAFAFPAFLCAAGWAASLAVDGGDGTAPGCGGFNGSSGRAALLAVFGDDGTTPGCGGFNGSSVVGGFLSS